MEPPKQKQKQNKTQYAYSCKKDKGPMKNSRKLGRKGKKKLTKNGLPAEMEKFGSNEPKKKKKNKKKRRREKKGKKTKTEIKTPRDC